MWRLIESGSTVWQSRFLSLLSHRNVAAVLLFVIGISAYLFVSIYTSSAFDGGNGTPSNPYIISTCAQLQEIDDQPEYLYASYILANDIDCSTIVPFETIGNYNQFNDTYRPFMGRFDGQGYTISNVTVGDSVTSFNGIFASTYGASIRNLNLDNIASDGISYIGALAGYVDDSTVVGVSLTNSTITLYGNSAGYGGGIIGRLSDSYVYGLQATTTTVTGTGTNTSNNAGFGGLVGNMSRSAIERSAAGVTVTADYPSVGGIVGHIQNGGLLKNVYSNSVVVGYTDVGGVAGSYSANGENSYIESVYSNASTTASVFYTGGILGGVSNCCFSDIYISNSFSVGKVASTTLSGGISGVPAVMDNNVYYPAGTGQTRCIWSGAGLPSGECTTNASSAYFNDDANLPLSNWDFINIWAEVVGNRPTLRVFPFAESSTSTVVSTCADLAANVRGNPNGWFELAGNIDCAGNPSLLPLTGNSTSSSAFYGKFDGQGYTVSGITMSRTAPSAYSGGVGLFTKLYGASVNDVTLTGGGITAQSRYIFGTGALAGFGHGVVIENVISSVPIHGGEQWTGGIIGYGSGYFNNINVSADLDYTYPENRVPYWTGGILGSANWAQITNSTFNGNLTGYWYIGGLVGYAGVLFLDNATTTGSVTGAVDVGGVWGVGGGEMNMRSEVNNAVSSVTLYPNHAEDSSFYLVGGLVGEADFVDITNSSYTGTIDIGLGYGESIGGLVGSIYGANATATIMNSTVEASITSDGDNGNNPYLESLGGMAGYAELVTITNSTASTTISLGSEPASNYINGINNVGGFIGQGFGDVVLDNVTAVGSISIFEDASGSSGGYAWAVGGFGGYFDGVEIFNSTSSVDIFLKSFEPGGISNFVGDLEQSSVTNVLVEGSLRIEAYEDPYSVGGLAGYASDIIVATTTVLGDITITDSLWPYDIGGLVGYLESRSIIQQTYTDNNITIEAGSNGTSRGPYAVGGFIGEMVNENILRDTYASTSISITTSALNQSPAAGNIGGYIGYIGWENNSITNSYATGAITIISDITAVFQRVGGFIGWSDWGANTYTDNFTVTAVAPIASSTYVGGFIGQYTGTETFSNNYFDQTTTLQTLCTGTDGTDPAWCFAENISSADPTFFFDATNSPMSSWNFTSLWLGNPDTYPTFGLGGSAATTPPTVASSAGATSITGTSADISGNITVLGSGSVTARGFAYGTSIGFGATTTQNSVGFSTGSFAASLTGLACGTTYYFAAYASGVDGLDYGSTETFATSACSGGVVSPSISTTVTVSAITETGALVQGNITALGSAAVTSRGFAYGVTSGLGATTTETGVGFATGTYTGTITGLACGTTYFYQAYALSADGIGYGAQQSFSTSACPVASTGTNATRVVVSDVNTNADEDYDVVSSAVTPTTLPTLPPKSSPVTTSSPQAAGQLVVCGENRPNGNPRRIVRVITNPPCNVFASTTASVANENSVSDVTVKPSSVPGLPENAELLMLPVTVEVTNENGVTVDDFESPVVIEVSDARVLGLSQDDFVVVQPGANEESWERLTFEVVGDTLRITVNRPGDLFIWFIPSVVEAAEQEEEENEYVVAAPIQLSVDRNIAWYLIYTGLLSGLLYALLQLAKAPFSVTRFDRVLLEAWRNLIGLITFRKKRQPWGTVYDSLTKAPVDPAYVRLYAQDESLVAEAITDLDGRYGFVVPEGTYSMKVQKTNYEFPSRNRTLSGADVIYHQLYYGEEFSTASAIAHDIPMDPQGFDWNQFEKLRTKQTKYFHILDPLIIRFIDVAFYVGLLFLLWQMLAAPSVYSGILLALYGVLLILRFTAGKPPLFGSIRDEDGPLPFALVQVMRGERVLFSKVADAYGRYVAIVPKDIYTVRYMKRMSNDEYETVFEGKVNAKKGVINQHVKV